MKTYLLIGSILLIGACGDNKSGAHLDAKGSDGSGDIDAPPPPPVPTLGAQVDRLGRPAINTTVNHPFDPNDTTKQAAKDAYNQDASMAHWATYVPEFANNIAILDSLDTKTNLGDGCGNQIGFNGVLGGGGAATANSYLPLATSLADDELYMDTAKSKCDRYLSVELEVLSELAIVHSTCGGRAPSYDVIDFSYTALAAGITGFNLNVSPPDPGVKDGASNHADTSDTAFPFFGAPH